MAFLVFPEELASGRAVALIIRDSRLFGLPNKASRIETVIQSRHPGTLLDCHMTKYQVFNDIACSVLSSIHRVVFVWPR
jgi:hypothetical protein